ncbi:MAG: hypothetical protein O2958_06565 [Gemmatimonadetes bacterium]|nr:hypothetical protein [Gemmatimonadota bacterium]
MKQASDNVTVVFMLGVMAFAIVLVDDRWVRTGLGLLPALLLAQRALVGAGVGTTNSSSATAPRDDRGADGGVREQIQELLKLIREFYSTCHMVAVGQLEPSKAKAKAQVVERRLNLMMADMLEQVEKSGSEA